MAEIRWSASTNQRCWSDGRKIGTAALEQRPKHISYASVMALFTALTYHDKHAANQSQRIADLCLALGRKQLDPRTLYWMEVCALLRNVSCLAEQNANQQQKELTPAERIQLTTDILRNTFGSEN
jgi:hypothetical protein